LWDLDSQGGATYALRGERQQHASAKKLLAGKRELPELILASGYPGLDLLPADFSYRNFAVHTPARVRSQERPGTHLSRAVGGDSRAPGGGAAARGGRREQPLPRD
jgi:cellulose biosynthesis protein BcsQ